MHSAVSVRARVRDRRARLTHNGLRHSLSSSLYPRPIDRMYNDTGWHRQ